MARPTLEAGEADEEATALLSAAPGSIQPPGYVHKQMADAGSWQGAQKQGSGLHLLLPELHMLFKLAGPTIVQTASQQAMVFTDQIFLGHLGTEAMAAAALGNMYAATLFFFLFGTATALDTLGAQVYGAHKQGVRTTVTLKTWCTVAALVLSLLCIPVTVSDHDLLAYLTEIEDQRSPEVGLSMGQQVAEALNQPPHIAKLTGLFCKGLIPGAWPLMWGLVLMKYLQVQNVVLGPALITATTLVLNIGSNFLFIHMLGFQGAPVATSCARLVQFLALCGLVLWYTHTCQCTKPLSAIGRLFLQGADVEPANHQLKEPCHAAGTADPVDHAQLQQNQLQRSEQGAGDVNCVGAGDMSGMPGGKQPSRGSVRGGCEDMPVGMRADGNNQHLLHDSSAAGEFTKQQVELVQQDSSTMLQEVPSTASEAAPCLQSQHSKHVPLLGRDVQAQLQVLPSHSKRHPEQPSGTSSLWPRKQWQRMPFMKLACWAWSELVSATDLCLLWEYLKIGLPGGFMMSLEQISFDVTIALAAQLGPATVSAHTAMLNITGLTFVSCPLAMGIAGSIRVGNLLGAGQPFLARISAWLCVAIGGVFMLCAALAILASRHVIGYMFTNDADVVAIMASIAPLAALFQVSDGVMGTAQGTLRGCGKQRLLMLFNFVGFWPCGWMFGYLLSFHWGFGLRGLWLGITSGVTITGVMNLVTLARTRWANESQLAQARQGNAQQEQVLQEKEAQPMLGSRNMQLWSS